MFQRLLIGTKLFLTSSVVAWNEIASIQPISDPTLEISGTTPLVERVILRRESDIPDGSIAIYIASFTASKLYKGSPMPISTTLLNLRGCLAKLFSLVGQSCKSCRASNICPIISEVVKFLTNF